MKKKKKRRRRIKCNFFSVCFFLIFFIYKGKLQGEGKERGKDTGRVCMCGVCRGLTTDYNKISLKIHFVLYMIKFGGV